MASTLAHLNESNSTPKTINRNRYLESVMDFSTPMSTMPNRWLNSFDQTSIEDNTIVENKTMTSDDKSDSMVMLTSTFDVNNNTNETIANTLIQKFNEHATSFRQTQTHLNSLDTHLLELSSIIDRLRNSMENNSLIGTTTDQLETRLLQMTIKREQIRTAIVNLNESPSVNQILKDIIEQISPSAPKQTMPPSDPMIYYAELVVAVQLSMNQKTNLIERLHHEQIHMERRTSECRSKVAQRQDMLMRLAEKIVHQATENKMYTTSNKESPENDQDVHTEQLAEFTKLVEEYRSLQDENRSLKQKAKQNIKVLYGSINQAIE